MIGKNPYKKMKIWAIPAVVGFLLSYAVSQFIHNPEILSLNLISVQANEPDYGKQFDEFIKGIRENSVNKESFPSDDTLFKIAVESILDAIGDKYGNYFDPQSYQDTQNQLTPANYTGVGVSIAPGTYGALILQIFDDSAIKFSGIREGDFIYAVGEPGGEFIEYTRTSNGSNIQELAEAIKGPEGTDVNLKVKRGGEDLGIITVQRVETRSQNVFMKLNDNGILDIRITEFSTTVSEDIVKWLEDNGHLNDDGGISKDIKAVSLDLRFNPGGSLSSAIRTVELFLPKERVSLAVISTQERLLYKTEKDPVFPTDIPKVVLFNGTSASASEIVAGAMSKYKLQIKAFTLGTQSYGKGSIQRFFPLPGGGAYKATIAKYLAGGDIEIDKVGLKPDMYVPQPTAPGVNGDWRRVNRHLIRISMDPEIDHQLHAAHEFLLRFTEGGHRMGSASSIMSAINKVDQTKTSISSKLCHDKGLKGCPSLLRRHHP